MRKLNSQNSVPTSDLNSTYNKPGDATFNKTQTLDQSIVSIMQFYNMKKLCSIAFALPKLKLKRTWNMFWAPFRNHYITELYDMLSPFYLKTIEITNRVRYWWGRVPYFNKLGNSALQLLIGWNISATTTYITTTTPTTNLGTASTTTDS